MHKQQDRITAFNNESYDGISDNKTTFLKKAVWLYFLLLIFEGALRKWLLPALDTPLLVVRDPIALFIVLASWRLGLLPSTPYLTFTIIIGVIALFTSLFFGHGNLAVAVFGARILLIHFPLMFAIGRIFNLEDVVKIGKATLYIAIPMTVLVTLQFYSPQSAWVNRGVGGSLQGAGFSGAGEFFRPPGTFSFTNGNTLFYSFAAPFIIYFFLNPEKINKYILLASGVALICAVPLSISRGLLFQVLISLIFTGVAIGRKPENLGKILLFLLVGLIALVSLSKFSFFQTATGAFSERYEIANESEGGLNGVLVDRYLGGMVEAIKNSYGLPFFGRGIGMGTNVGSSLLTGETTFLIAEGEWGRLIGEMGPLLGIFLIAIRVFFSIRIAWASFKKIASGNLLPWVLVSFGLLLIPQGQWGQPTSLGFSTLLGGLIIASLRVSN
ncbi:hypothetical protein SAE01_29490 [Segetibacter aerophilus]|uniref:O-antigen polymerase n=2 Tax=Segetibacter aerophilus TaxID=670293 RepID=A0A512BEQ7_9BACT|nr:hypothetical protein SAE01_29490 [Segetibacter aerophilus]